MKAALLNHCVCAVGLMMSGALLSADAAEVLTLGKDGQINWQGRVASGLNFVTSTPEYRSPLNPNQTLTGNSPSNLIEFSSDEYVGSILPGSVQDGENIATRIGERGGRLSAPTVLDMSDALLQSTLEQLVTAPSNGRAFERKGNFVLGTLLALDLGGRFGVNKLRFFPRNTVFPSPTTPYQGDFLKNFEVHINDGTELTQAGNPIWQLYETRANNADAVTEIVIDPPRLLRFLRLRATSSIPFEIEKIQVFGEGFFPTVRYYSPVIDMGTPANWGKLRWVQQLIGNSNNVDMQIRSRSGNDATPLAYTRKRVGLQDAEEIALSVDDPTQPLERREYLSLPEKGGQSDEWERGTVRDDLANWSSWTPPYSIEEGTSEEGTLLLSPGPRRYIQFRVDFLSEDLETSYVLEQLSLEYTSPPLADALIGEVFPREVDAATDVPMVYALRADMRSGLVQGFDAFEMSTSSRVKRVERLEILDGSGRVVVDHVFAVQDQPTTEGDVQITSIDESSFSLRFPRVSDNNAVVKVHFVSRVLSFSTTFEGRALLLEAEAFQNVVSGDATQLDDSDVAYESGVTVLSPAVNTGSLVGRIDLSSGVFTPNSDNANDRVAIEFEVLAVVGQARLTVDIYDLNGDRKRRLFDASGGNGTYDAVRLPELLWDGKDDSGSLLPPGMYVVKVEVQGDARSGAQLRTVGVAY
jgi:hypothetical protein